MCLYADISKRSILVESLQRGFKLGIEEDTTFSLLL
jgi:hypothetical protein